MKKMWNYFASILVMGLFAGCSNDTLTGDDSDGDLNGSKDAVYMNVSVQLPAGGGIGARSETKPEGGSTDGEEMGKDYENKVGEVLLVLATIDDKFIAQSIVEETDNAIKVLPSSSFNTTKKISKSTLANYYSKNTDPNKDLVNDKIHVYVFCNPTEALKNTIAKAQEGSVDWVNESAEITKEVWAENKFLMSNAIIAEKKLPKKLEYWDDYTAESNAFDLSGRNNYGSDKEVDNSRTGAIKVERSVARFDFKDGSRNNNTYDVVKQEGNTIMQIQLQKIALVNMSKNFYYLRRVSSTGLDADCDMCGVETATNYVVDTDAEYKNGDNIDINSYKDHFDYCLGAVVDGTWKIDQNARAQWDVHDIAKILADNAEKDEYKDKEYKIWRYVTENTIPGALKQRQGITTGIVFKGKMIVPESAPETSLTKALAKVTGESMKDDILYTYLTNIYVTWKEVRAAALRPEANKEFYKAVFGVPENAEEICVEEVGNDGKVTKPAVYSKDINSPDYLWNAWHEENNHANINDMKYWEKFRAAAVNSLFTIYQSSKEGDDPAGYYCYYFYWVRHNDNVNNGIMGPMEFAVVRNNVYKLAVTKIDRLGHPRISDNDPDPVDPEDPDDKGDVYLTLSVEVLPWVVRVNNIEF